MNKAIKVMQTYAFIGRAMLYTRPPSYKFIYPNRKKFESHIESLDPKDEGTRLFKEHLLSINSYCDLKGVTLTEYEYNKLKCIYIQGEISLSVALMEENICFKGTLDPEAPEYKIFDIESWDYCLRAYRLDMGIVPGSIKF